MPDSAVEGAAAAKPVPPKIVPLIRSDSKEYWAAAADGRFVLQQCGACSRFQFYPRSLCHYCFSTDLKWTEASGGAEVYSYTRIYRPPTAAYRDEVPYVLALVNLDEGPRMMTKIVTDDPESVDIGMRVAVTFERIDDEVTLPCFRPA